MNDCIFRDFDVATRPCAPPKIGTAGVPAIQVTLTHRETGMSSDFTMYGVLCGLDRLIEQHVRTRFPESASARELAKLAGANFYRLSRDWRSNLPQRINAAILGHCESPGGMFWWHLLGTMPRVVKQMLFKRTDRTLAELAGAHSQRQFADAVRGAWAEVLVEGCELDGWRDVVFTSLYRKGWPMAQLDDRSREQLGAIAQCCRLAHMALAYLTDDDWQKMLANVIEVQPTPRGQDEAAQSMLEAIFYPEDPPAVAGTVASGLGAHHA